MPTITQLEYIVTVERLRHFGQAAKTCHVSQPSLSMQIQKVEDEVGFSIFDRLKKPVLPTPKGERFIAQAKLLLNEYKKLLNVSQREQGVISGEFRLGIIPTVAPYLLPHFIGQLSAAYPKLNLKIDELNTESILRGLRSDQLDAGILATPLHETGLIEKPLYYETFHLYVSSSHKLAQRKRIREDDLDGSEMWLLQDGHCLRNQIIKFCSLKSESGVFKNIQFEGGNLETLRYLVKSSVGYTLLPQLFINTFSGAERSAHVRDFESPAPTREISLIYRRDEWKSDILDAIEKTIGQHLPPGLSAELKKNKSEVLEIR